MVKEREPLEAAVFLSPQWDKLCSLTLAIFYVANT